MKTSPNMTHYASKADYMNRRSLPKGLAKSAESASSLAPKDNVAISEEAKAASQLKPDQPEVPVEDKNIKEEVKDTLKGKGNEAKEAGGHLLKQAGQAIGRALSSTPLPMPTPSIVDQTAKTEDILARPNMMNDRPGVFFVTGFHINPFDTDEMGLTGMSRGVPGSQVFKWNQEDNILDQIRKIPPERPLILVGHGMGGDTVVNIANKLNSADNGFRKINLMVTLDSIGWDNDIIPQNVAKNLNYISDQDMFFNDGPNIARNKETSTVVNELRTENHNDLQESPEIQFEIFQNINEVMAMDRMKTSIQKAKIAMMN